MLPSPRKRNQKLISSLDRKAKSFAKVHFLRSTPLMSSSKFIPPFWATKADIRRVERKLDIILFNQGIQMATLDDLVNAVNDESTVEDSVVTLLTTIHQQLKDALANSGPAAQAKIDQVFAQIQANKNKIAQAIVANTDAGTGGGGTTDTTATSGGASTANTIRG